MPKEKEDLRIELLIQGIEHERITEQRRAWMSSVAVLPVLPDSGKFVGGAGLDHKLDAYYDFTDQLLPYLPSRRPKEATEEAPEVQDKDRNDLVNMYKEMVASGKL